MKTQPRHIKRFRTDEHGAFEGIFEEYLDSQGTKHEVSIRYEHENMGWIERFHRTVGERHRSQMTAGKVPIQLQGYSLLMACYITNRVFTRTEEKTPFEMRFGTRPDFSNIRQFFAPAVVTIPVELQRKSNPSHGLRCRYLDPCDNKPGDWFVDCSTNQIISSNKAEFFEDCSTNPTIDITDYNVSFPEEETNDDDYVEVIPKPVIPPSNPLSTRRSPRFANQPSTANVAPCHDDDKAAVGERQGVLWISHPHLKVLRIILLSAHSLIA
jgi:hypothetical protein